MTKSNKVQLAEADLVSALLRKERFAIEVLYDMYSAALYGIIVRIVPEQEAAEDLLQEVFVKIWNSFSGYDADRGRLFTWMANIARNLAIDRLRSKDYRNSHKNQDLENSVHAVDNKHRSVFNTETVGLKEMVASLMPEERSILNLLYFQGYTHTEAAEELNIPVGTLKTRLRRAILNLRKFFN